MYHFGIGLHDVVLPVLSSCSLLLAVGMTFGIVRHDIYDGAARPVHKTWVIVL